MISIRSFDWTGTQNICILRACLLLGDLFCWDRLSAHRENSCIFSLQFLSPFQTNYDILAVRALGGASQSVWNDIVGQYCLKIDSKKSFDKI